MLLGTPRIIIRNFILDDLTDFHRYRSNPEVTKYQGFAKVAMLNREWNDIKN
ncbi:MAG TPA: hypothetical protein PKN22_06390 [Taishania sp.]|nr:hypothetical protein [Taishania sp.]